ncbi:hypothetical protein CLLI_28290 [Clostridium liquoris]|jgi:Skp family chaperone for outer membrane proteins|uniref:Uncharacterized protein n=1 Tax=Clostridium liquoris TaxID=1289519 RepID=A0A2T0B0C1_9CLOT|nr:hypothetical protein [Clostridium liquoris]PRR76895.1 hypothetical protein CLLI_28290 [Clostridium liquoris]
MEFTIKRIIAIDEGAERFRENKKEEIEKKREELQNEIQAMTREEETDIKNIEKETKQKTIVEAEKQVESIKSQKEEQVNLLYEKFKNAKDKIIQETISDILSSPKEE